MNAPGRMMVLGLVLLMLITWLGFSVHVSPRFAGSFWGGVFGVSGSILMLIPLFYLFIKRISFLKNWVTQYVSMNTLLSWHIYTGIIGSILVLIHTGHKFNSALGIALTATTLIVTISGFIGRYLMGFMTHEIDEKKAILVGLQRQYQIVAQELQSSTYSNQNIGKISLMRARFLLWLLEDTAFENHLIKSAEIRALSLAETISELEYAIRFHEYFKRVFQKWLACHIITALALYVLLGLHVWSGIYFGLRWFQ
ncbi:hypothetical protein SDC14_00040 [Legionella pneumophila serogroup 1]|uniref:Ferric reductase like transmembrane component n=1 Tax=Legionella moravica TaxID=39962 RepID=A0A378JVQ3_9GAMM|nr:MULTISPECIES: hypothetical protein [Legionella]HAT7049461.1 hypothetical protein [Legionella pneumophila]KTD31798.1 hypothetical protein Lmor_2674 [Legionella moravica]STX62120.1 Uncharacterised protein [Legionella moravica]HAT7054634.1 hypothetical protein [Legionella pneumophila]HAT7064293.1 hypothetical protein [Legionella pneumophila]